MLANIQTVVEILQGLATIAAVIVGGAWAYFRFVKERTYQPRLEVALTAEWHSIAGLQMLAVRIEVKNIGESQIFVPITESFLTLSQPMNHNRPIQKVEFSELLVVRILQEHKWVESDETVYDELLFNVGSAPNGVQLTSVLAPTFDESGKDLKIHLRAKRFVPAPSTEIADAACGANIITIGKTEISDGRSRK